MTQPLAPPLLLLTTAPMADDRTNASRALAAIAGYRSPMAAMRGRATVGHRGCAKARTVAH
jgi:hypothetical protein